LRLSLQSWRKELFVEGAKIQGQKAAAFGTGLQMFRHLLYLQAPLRIIDDGFEIYLTFLYLRVYVAEIGMYPYTSPTLTCTSISIARENLSADFWADVEP